MAQATPAPIIYVVDDDTDVLGSLRFLLETDGFDVRTFRSGAALLNGNAAGKVDCFVIDYKMPAMSGIDLANRLQSRHEGTPIILITGYPDETIQEKAAESASTLNPIIHVGRTIVVSPKITGVTFSQDPYARYVYLRPKQ